MADTLWLQDKDGNKLILDSKIREVKIGGYKRDYKVIQNIGTPGGQIRGFGAINSRKIKVTRREFVSSSGTNFFNTERSTFIQWMLKPRYVDLWLYLVRDDGTTTRAVAFPNMGDGDKFDSFLYGDDKDFEILLPEGLFVNTSESSTTLTTINDFFYTMTVTNNGEYEAPFVFSYTPDAAAWFFQASVFDTFGFSFEFGSSVSPGIPAGQTVTFDTSNGELRLNGALLVAEDYKTAGSVFNIFPGTNSLDVRGSQSGEYEVTYNERFI
jgi:hypothetical protein